MIEVACGIMFNKNNKILLGKRPKNKFYGGIWEFPGGQKENYENIEECLKREWLEELNLHINIEKEVYNYYYDNKYFCRFFVGKIINEENIKIYEHEKIVFVEKDKITDYKIFDGDEIVLSKF